MIKLIMRNLILVVLFIIALILIVWFIKADHKNNKAAPVAAPVEVTSVVKKDEPYIVELAGEAESYQTVNVSSQVTGQILTVNFDDGQEVQTNDLLYEIDPRPFQNQLQEAEANLLSDTYNLKNAEKEEVRYRALYKEKAVSDEQYQQMLTNRNMLRASVEKDKALIANANLQIEYSKIVAPADGKLSENNFDIGNLVEANSGVSMVTINTISPIYVSFPMPEEYMSHIDKSKISTTLSLVVKTSTGQEIKDGQVIFIDNNIDPTSSTIKVKAVFPNTQEILWPGQFVRVSLNLYTQHDALIVPPKAIQNNDQGTYVFVVEDNKAVIRNVEVDFANDNYVVIKSGLTEGETVVVNGQVRLSNNMEVIIKKGEE